MRKRAEYRVKIAAMCLHVGQRFLSKRQREDIVLVIGHGAICLLESLFFLFEVLISERQIAAKLPGIDWNGVRSRRLNDRNRALNRGTSIIFSAGKILAVTQKQDRSCITEDD